MTDPGDAPAKLLFQLDVKSLYLQNGRRVAEMILIYGSPPDPERTTLRVRCPDAAGLRALARELEHVADVLEAKTH